MPIRGYSRGGKLLAFDTVDELVAAHVAQPLASGMAWRVGNPLLFGTVEEGQLVPDPLDPNAAPDPLFTRSAQARVVWRGLAPELNAASVPHDIEGS